MHFRHCDLAVHEDDKVVLPSLFLILFVQFRWSTIMKTLLEPRWLKMVDPNTVMTEETEQVCCLTSSPQPDMETRNIWVTLITHTHMHIQNTDKSEHKTNKTAMHSQTQNDIWKNSIWVENLSVNIQELAGTGRRCLFGVLSGNLSIELRKKSLVALPETSWENTSYIILSQACWLHW